MAAKSMKDVLAEQAALKTQQAEPEKKPEEKQEDASVKKTAEEELAASLGLSEVPKFRVFNFAYQFKTGLRVLAPNADGIYEPQGQEEFDLLAWQVRQGRILFN